MFCQDADGFLGCPYQGIETLKNRNANLASKVWQQVNDSQELVLINDFARENNEFQLKKSVQDRISDINSWRWVLEDLSKRLDEAMATLQYEHKAIRVVVERVKSEIRDHSRESTRPGAMGPMTDSVEEAIKEEHDFLRDQKRNFEKMLIDLEKQVNALQKTNMRIQQDILKKYETITLEEACVGIDLNSIGKVGTKSKKKTKLAHVAQWEKRCACLKKDGLRALNDAFNLRQQLRGARVQLSIVAQQFASKVDSAIRKRLHANNAKLHELDWQKQEALRDLATLDEELSNTEQSLLINMEHERVMEARLADRAKRPRGELTKDSVDRKLRDELARLRLFIKSLRDNITRINALKQDLSDSIAKIDCCAEDLMTVLRLDSERIQSRIGEQSGSNYPTVSSNPSSAQSYGDRAELRTIKEEDEDEDDYPFDD